LYKKFGKDQDRFDYMLRLFGKGERATPFETGVAGLKSSLQTLGAAGLERLGFEDAAKEQLAAAQARQEDIAQRYKPEVPSFTDITGPSSAARYAYEKAAESIPYMAAPVAGAIVGGIVGGPVGAGVGATVAGVPTFAGSNIERQIQEGETLESASLTKATAVAVPQAALDAIITRYIPGLGRATTGSLLKRTVTQGLRGGRTEALTESAQQALEIAQADPEKLLEFSPEVRSELLEAAVAGGILGAGFGAVGGATNKQQETPPAPTTPTTPTPQPGTPPTQPGTPPTQPGTPPVQPGTPPVVPPITSDEPLAENDWVKANRERLQAFNETPIQTQVTEAQGTLPPKVETGKMRLFYDPSTAEADGTFTYNKDPAALAQAGAQTIRFVDVPDTVNLKTDQAATIFKVADPQEEQGLLQTAQDYDYREGLKAPATFANMVDKALYAIAKNANPEDVNLAKEYLTQGLGMAQDEIDAKSKEVETKVDEYLARVKEDVGQTKRGATERIIAPDVSGRATVATFPAKLEINKIAGIDVNTTDPQQRAKLDKIIADTKTNYVGNAKQKIETAFPGFSDVLRTVQERLFPGLTFMVSAKEDPDSYGYMHPTQYAGKKTFALNFSLGALKSPEKAVRTLFHEMFHVMEFTWLTDLPKDQLNAIIQQYVKESVPSASRRIAQTKIQSAINQGTMSKDMMKNPAAYLKKHFVVKNGEVRFKDPTQAGGTGWDLTKAKDAEYYFGFSEWIAEKGAEWVAGSARKVDSKLDSAFKKLYDNLRTLYYEISKFFGVEPSQGAFEQLLSEMWGNVEATPEKNITRRYANVFDAQKEATAAGVPLKGVTYGATPSAKAKAKAAAKAGKRTPLSSAVDTAQEATTPEGAIVTRVEPGYTSTGDRLVSEAHPLTEADVKDLGVNPALIGNDVPVEIQQLGQFTTATKQKGVWGRLFDAITGREEGESHAQAIFRNSVASAIPFMNRAGFEGVGQTLERMQNVQGRVAGLLNSGFLVYDKKTGDMRFDNTNGGLIKIFDRIGTRDENAFQQYAIARRELDLRRKAGYSGFGYKNPVTGKPFTDAELEEIVRSAPAHFKEVADEFQAFNKGMVQFAINSGLIPQELGERFMSMFYTPFYRAQEKGDPNGTLHPAITKALDNPRNITAFNQAVSAGGAIEQGFYDNTLRNYSSIVAAGLKNIAYNKVAEAAIAYGDPSIAQKVGKPGADGVITYRVNGGDQFLKINDVPMFQALSAMSPKQLGAAVEAASKVANVLRTGVTIAPPFQIANLWRGIIDTYVKTGMPITDLIAGTFRNFREVYRKGPSYQAILAATGFGGYGYGAGFRDQAEFMRRAYTSADISKPWGLAMKALDKLEHIGEATEMASRVTYFDYLVKKKGMDPTTAAYEAVNLTNFNRSGAGGGVAGNILMHLIPMIPFLNARVQGLYRLIERGTAGAPESWLAKGTIGIPKALVIRGLQLTAIELALNMIYGDDDWYKKLSVEDKIANNYFRVGDTVIAAPRAFEIGSVFGAIPALMMDSIREKEGAQFTDGLLQIMSSTFLFNPIPQAVKPIAEVVVNKDMFTWQDIETIADKRRPQEERADENTTEIAKALANYVVPVISPKQADVLLRGYFGTMGSVFASMVDGIFSGAGTRPSGYFGDPTSLVGIGANATGLSRFVKDPELMRNRFVKDFYDMKSSVTQVVTSIDDAGVTNNFEILKEKLKDDPAAEAVYKVLNKAENQITEINKQMKSIRLDPNLSGDEKSKRLTALRNVKNQTAEQAFKFGRQYGYE
jgi:hypothetical protein